MAVDKKMPIMIVDDYNTMLRIMKNLLRQLDFADESAAYALSVGYRDAGWMVRLGDASAAMTLVERNGQHLVIKLNGATVRGTVVRDADAFHVFSGGACGTL